MRGLLASFGGIRYAGAALLIAPYGRVGICDPVTSSQRRLALLVLQRPIYGLD